MFDGNEELHDVILDGAVEPLRRDADDGVDSARSTKLAIDDRGVGAEVPLPGAVTQHQRRRRAGSMVCGDEKPPQMRPETQRVEVVL